MCPLAGINIDDVQKDIETPENMLPGMPQVTTNPERLFDDMRPVDVLSLSDRITFNRFNFQDDFINCFGYNPVRYGRE